MDLAIGVEPDFLGGEYVDGATRVVTAQALDSLLTL